MEKCQQCEGVIRDDRAVALTEFCIVMPVILFFFLAILQYFEFVRVSQMANYAAYVSARSYAVLHTESDARLAASLALAPVANNVSLSSLPIPGISSLLQDLGNLIPGGKGVVRYANGLANAYFFLWLGNNFSVTTNSVAITSSSSGGGFANLVGGLAGGSPWQSPDSVTQVNVSINYPQFINIPGLRGLWMMLGSRDYSAWDHSTLYRKFQYYNQMYQLADGTSSVGIGLSMLLADGCVNIPARCSTGYELWGSPDDYQKAEDNLGEFTSTFSKDDWDPNGTKWIPRQPSKSQ